MARIKGVDIPDNKRIEISLTYIYGIGRSLSNQILNDAKIDVNKRAGKLSNDELNSIREQLDKFYIPFYKIYCRGFLSELRLSELNFETWSCILDLMSDNLHLMEPESQSMYSKYYLAYLNMLEAQDGNPMFPVEQTSQNLDEAFNTLCGAIFREYVTLLRKLKLPVPILPTHKNSAL